MEQEQIKLYLDCTINLLKSVILDEEPKPISDQIDFNELFEFALIHKVENIIYLALKKLNVSAPIMGQFEEYYNHAILNDATQQYYLELIEYEFQKNNIDYMVMKGSVLKYYYPTTDLRQSGDVDIYFRNKDSEKIKNIMVNMGFNVLEYGEHHIHDKYQIDNAIEFEMHRSLIDEKYYEWGNLCKEIEENIYSENGCKHKSSNEYYYMYMIAHMAKHMKYGGVGIRFILDIWVYLKKYNDILDWDFIEDRLKFGHLYEFEKCARKLSYIWFENEPYDDVSMELAMYIAENGLFGTQEHYVISEYVMKYGSEKMTAKNKIARYAGAIFMPYSKMIGKYPILKKYKILLPLCWIDRIIRACLFKRERINDISHYFDNVKSDDVARMQEFKRKIGL